MFISFLLFMYAGDEFEEMGGEVEGDEDDEEEEEGEEGESDEGAGFTLPDDDSAMLPQGL